VLTWSDDGLTYALVSDLEERGQASCIVCHRDKRVFKGFNRLQTACKSAGTRLRVTRERFDARGGAPFTAFK
jgi:hypothetical protein